MEKGVGGAAPPRCGGLPPPRKTAARSTHSGAQKGRLSENCGEARHAAQPAGAQWQAARGGSAPRRAGSALSSGQSQLPAASQPQAVAGGGGGRGGRVVLVGQVEGQWQQGLAHARGCGQQRGWVRASGQQAGAAGLRGEGGAGWEVRQGAVLWAQAPGAVLLPKQCSEACSATAAA